MKKSIVLTIIILITAIFNCLFYGSNTKNYKERNGIEGIIANIQVEYKKIVTTNLGKNRVYKFR